MKYRFWTVSQLHKTVGIYITMGAHTMRQFNLFQPAQNNRLNSDMPVCPDKIAHPELSARPRQHRWRRPVNMRIAKGWPELLALMHCLFQLDNIT